MKRLFITVTLSFSEQELKAMEKAVKAMNDQGYKYYYPGHEIQALAGQGMKHSDFYQEQERQNSEEDDHNNGRHPGP